MDISDKDIKMQNLDKKSKIYLSIVVKINIIGPQQQPNIEVHETAGNLSLLLMFYRRKSGKIR